MRSIKSRGALTRDRGFNESIGHQWIHTAHYCAVIHQTMSSGTKIVSKGSEQHEELGKSRICRDSTDLATIQDWFLKNNSFDECITEFVRNKAKGRIVRAYQGGKKRTCAYQGVKNVRFLEN